MAISALAPARKRLLPFVLLLAAAIAGCTLGGSEPDHEAELETPRTHAEWSALLADIRSLERRMGFSPTKNFLRVEDATAEFPFCGHVSPLYLPYSYEDPAIQWIEVETEDECRAAAGEADVTFGATEAVGERDTPITPRLLVAPLPRFVYVVIHEDCHDQFDLPYGIEEPLCNVLTYEAMTAFAAQRFANGARERRAIERFAREGAARGEVTRELYGRLALLYARHQSTAISAETLLRERGHVFRAAERKLSWEPGSANNVWLANLMTYSRHEPVVQRALAALGRDLSRAVAFFREVDAAKPQPTAFAAARGLESDTTLAFVRGYETALVALIEARLATRAR